MGAESIAFICLMVIGGLLLLALAGCRLGRYNHRAV